MSAYVVERRGRKSFAAEWNELETDAYLLEEEVLSLTGIVGHRRSLTGRSRRHAP